MSALGTNSQPTKPSHHGRIDILSQALEDTDYRVRWFATEALGQIVSEATIPVLKRAIQDEDNWVRCAPTKELVTGTPWQYNLLKFEGVPKSALAPQAIFIFMGN